MASSMVKGIIMREICPAPRTGNGTANPARPGPAGPLSRAWSRSSVKKLRIRIPVARVSRPYIVKIDVLGR